jgi:hypothetical protein
VIDYNQKGCDDTQADRCNQVELEEHIQFGDLPCLDFLRLLTVSRLIEFDMMD